MSETGDRQYTRKELETMVAKAYKDGLKDDQMPKFVILKRKDGRYEQAFNISKIEWMAMTDLVLVVSLNNHKETMYSHKEFNTEMFYAALINGYANK